MPLFTVVAVALLGMAGTAAAATRGGPSGPCSTGTLAPGTYSSVTITANGFCRTAPTGTVTINGNLTIQANAVFDAAVGGRVDVTGNVLIGPRTTVAIGCIQVEFPCMGAKGTRTHDVIGGSVFTRGSLTVILHADKVLGSLSMLGGGGGVNCNPNPVIKSTPNYFDVESSVIKGNVKVGRVQSCYFGFIRNQVNGRTTLSNLTMADPDANEIVSNSVFGYLRCFGDSPAPQFGDSGGLPNYVYGPVLGQCRAVSQHVGP